MKRTKVDWELLKIIGFFLLMLTIFVSVIVFEAAKGFALLKFLFK